MVTEGVAYVISGKTGERVPVAGHHRQNEQRLQGRFIRGPIPLAWVEKAAKISKSALMMALGIAYIRGLERKDAFRLCPARLQEAGVTRSSRSRGLIALEQAGLIRVLERSRGRTPLVSVDWE